MKLRDARITMLVGEDGLKIELYDGVSSVHYAEVRLTPEQFAQALGRLGNTHCTAEVYNLEKLNKRHEHKMFEFELPYDPMWKDRVKVASEAVLKVCPEGWEPDLHFMSQGSFFNKDGKPWARTAIRRWVEMDEEQYEQFKKEREARGY